MTNQKRLALLLAAAIAATSLSVSAANTAEDSSTSQPPAVSQQESPEVSADQSQQESPEPSADQSQPESTDAPADQPQTEPDTPALQSPAADPEGTLSFANLDSRVRAGSLDYLYLEEMIAQVEAIDYEELKEDMREGLNSIANAQWNLAVNSPDFSGLDSAIPGLGLGSALQGIVSMNTSATQQNLRTQYAALREQFDDLKEGKIQQDAADGVRQMRHAQNNIVLLAQSAYVQLMEAQAGSITMDRALETLDRQLEELELRYEMGQISALTLQEVQAARTSLVSSQQTLQNSMSTGLMNLENLVGAGFTGKLQLTGLPTVTGEQLSAMDLEADLAAAKNISYTLYASQKALDDAKETFEEAKDDFGPKEYQLTQAQHAWQAAQHTYQGTVRSFELSFRTLFNQVKDYAQVLQAAQTALAAEQSSFAAAQLKYEQGTISRNAMLSAQDEVSTAQDKVDTAQRNLFSAYNNYRWAVDHGILN